MIRIKYLLLLSSFFFLLAGCGEDDDMMIIEPTLEPAEAPTGFSHEYAQVNGINLHYVIGGQGEALLLLHGWPQNWYEWNRIMPALAQNYRVIVPDMRGIGESDKPLGTDNYTKKIMAEDMHQLIESLGFDKVKIASHDIGGMVAYTYASMYPDEVEKLAIMEAPIPGVEPFWTMLLAREDLLLWHFGLNQTEGSEELVVGNERAYLNRMFTDFSANPNAFNEAEVDEFVRAYSGLDALRGGFEWYRAFNQDVIDNQEFIQNKLTIPTLTIGGEFSLGGLMLPLVNSVVDSTYVTGGMTEGILPNTGHWVLEERTNEVLNELQIFFQ